MAAAAGGGGGCSWSPLLADGETGRRAVPEPGAPAAPARCARGVVLMHALRDQRRPDLALLWPRSVCPRRERGRPALRGPSDPRPHLETVPGRRGPGRSACSKGTTGACFPGRAEHGPGGRPAAQALEEGPAGGARLRHFAGPTCTPCSPLAGPTSAAAPGPGRTGTNVLSDSCSFFLTFSGSQVSLLGKSCVF